MTGGALAFRRAENGMLLSTVSSLRPGSSANRSGDSRDPGASTRVDRG